MTLDLHHGDCLEVLALMPDACVDAVITDPPYGLSFMGKGWDYQVPSVEIWEQCLRVLKPGGHLLAFAGTRTQHRMCVNIEDAGFEIKDMIAWVYGSGFPKSMDVSKAIDKARVEDKEPTRVVCRFIRAAMDAQGLKSKDLTQHFGGCHARLIDHWAARDTDSQPNLPTWEQYLKLKDVLGLSDEMDAEAWRLNNRKGKLGDSWQTAEVVGNAELPDTTQVRAGFVGMTAPDGKTPHRSVELKKANSPEAQQWKGWGTALKPALEPITVARKPFKGTVANNVLTHGTGALNIDACRVAYQGDYRSPARSNGEVNSAGVFGGGIKKFDDAAAEAKGRWPANLIHDGSDEVTQPLNDSARFFYTAKASKDDRDKGNTHPTVKPSDLMAYLCRLVTPTGGIVLDPFMGSGTTGKAALSEGFGFVGIERDPEYYAICESRFNGAQIGLALAV